VNWVLEADIVSFFDSLDRTELKKLIQIRVADGSLLRLIGKCLHVGVLDGADYTEPEQGTIQGSGLSPLLGNIYLHYVLDLWFEREVKPRLLGKATLIRYADDLLITFENQDDAKRVMEVLGKRMGRFGLTLHPDKTRLLPFRRPPSGSRAGKVRPPSTFLVSRCTSREPRQEGGGCGARPVVRACDGQSSPSPTGVGANRHKPVKVQHEALCRRIQGTTITSASAATFVVCCWCSRK